MFDRRVYDHFKRMPEIIATDIFHVDDTVLHCPVQIFTLCSASIEPVPGLDGTIVAFYVMGTAMPRIGTDSDIDIIQDMISDNTAVVCLDFGQCPDAVCPKLETAIQTHLQNAVKGCYFKGLSAFPEGTWPETHVVPAGYRMMLNRVFFSLDKHGPTGVLEKIVNIWNNDFRGVKGNEIIRWTDENGHRKLTQPGHDGTEPEWLDQNGNIDPDGAYIRVKHTRAVVFGDCVRRDGRPLLMDLKMDIIYPSNPTAQVPVMCLSCSNEHLATPTQSVDRPQFTGFLMRGYACVNFEYGYTPMARTDHYGYFDGNSYKESVTGRNTTYSLQFFCETKISSAAIRYIRYLALSDKRFRFNINAIGVYGNSKGGWMGYLAHPCPEDHPSRMYFSGHHGESLFESGIPGAEKDPWTEYDGHKINGHVNFIYPSCGGNCVDVCEGNAPFFISCNLQDGSGYRMSAFFASLCRTHDVPSIVAVCDAGHSFSYGPECRYGYDTYQILFDFADTVLKGAKPRLLYQTSDRLGNPVAGFTGVVSADDAASCFNGHDMHLVSSYGGTVWTNVIKETPAPKRTEKEVIPCTDFPCEPYVRTLLENDHMLLKVTENIDADGKSQFVNESFYTNPTPAFFMKIPCLGADRMRISIKVKDTVRRRIHTSFLYPKEAVRQLHLDQNMKNFVTVPDEWTEIALCQDIIPDTECFIFNFKLDSTGDTEKPILLSDMMIERDYL